MTNSQDLVKRYNGMKFKTKEPILDIGGADGRFLESQGIEQATIFEGTKFSDGKYKYIQGDATKKLPDFGKKFGTIFLMEILEHLKNPLYLMAQVYDLLKDEGVCYVAVPYDLSHPQHVQVWTKKQIINQMSKLGFIPKVIQSRRRFKGLGFWLPHCWLVLELKKRKFNSTLRNIKDYKLEI